MSITINQVKIENPYAIVLLPNYNIVRIGEKEVMEVEYKNIIDKINNYDGEITPITKQVVSMLQSNGFDINEPTKEEVLSLVDDYMLLQLPMNQEEVTKMFENTGYLK